MTREKMTLEQWAEQTAEKVLKDILCKVLNELQDGKYAEWYSDRISEALDKNLVILPEDERFHRSKEAYRRFYWVGEPLSEEDLAHKTRIKMLDDELHLKLEALVQKAMESLEISEETLSCEA